MSSGVPATLTTSVIVHAARAALTGDLTLPLAPAGVIVFADATASGRLSAHNRYAAESLARGGFATLVFDLLTRAEESTERYTRQLRLDVPLLADRLAGTVGWLEGQPQLRDLPIGLFGTNTGAAAALVIATRTPGVRAIVSRSGRADLAHEALRKVRAPTLLIVGGGDTELMELNHRALRRISANAKLHVIPSAGRALDEPGALDEALRHASSWFREHLIEHPPELAVSRAPWRPS
jgi:dienelactone hydrolase